MVNAHIDKQTWLVDSTSVECVVSTGLANSDSGVQESTRIHPNPTLERIRNPFLYE